ncbi:MAG: hypothetical protein JXB04_08735 [Kiritimatiellae bacterium]|nr:hypothetical protein [Kiritimatiellia bacterium]
MKDAALNVVDALVALFALWCLVPTLVFGRELQIPLPGGDYISSSLSSHNLVSLWVLLLVRLGLRAKARRPPVVERWFGGASPALQAVFIGAACLLLYLAAGQERMWPSGDTVPAKLVPISILEERNLDLDEFADGIHEGRRYGLYRVGGRAFSAYPPGTALTALPVYAAAYLLFPDAFHSWRAIYGLPGGDDLPNVANVLELLAAALIAALAAVAFWRLCMTLSGDVRTALWFTAAYAAGTSLLSTAAIALWQHGPACLFLGLVLLFLLRAQCGRAGPLVLAGLCAGWAYVCRPTTAVITVVLFLWILKRFRMKALWFAGPVGAVLALLLAWNRVNYGSFAGGYAQNVSLFARFDPRVALALLFSPSRGLFVFSPFLLFAVVLGMREVRRAPLGLPAFCLYAAISQVALFSCWKTWAAGSSFGPRYLCEAALLLAVLLPAGFRARAGRKWIRVAFVAAVLFSCHVHILGARHGDHGWTDRAFKGDDLSAAWNVRDSQLAWTLGRPPRP